MKFNKLAVGSLLSIALASRAYAACDLCSIYVAQQVRTFHPGQVTIGAFEQFSSFEKLQTNGDRIPDPAQQSLKGSTTQLFSRYDFSEDFSLQANVPLIARRYRRATENGIEEGSESGVGDISISGLFSPYTYQGHEEFFRVTLQGGIKMPTGDSSRLKEEVQEGHHGSQHEELGNLEHGHSELEHSGEELHHLGGISRNMSLKHGGVDHGATDTPTAIHGHDLALGSGSWDFFSGANFFGQVEHWIAAGSIQYTYRMEGDYDYRFADVVFWDLGVGRYVYTSEVGTIALRLNFLGEAKGMDQLKGADQTDTGTTALFYGPEINFTVKGNIFGLLALDLPALVNNTDTMVVQDYRMRMAVMYRF